MEAMFVLVLGAVTVNLLRRFMNCEKLAPVKLQGGINNFPPTWLKKVEGLLLK